MRTPADRLAHDVTCVARHLAEADPLQAADVLAEGCAWQTTGAKVSIIRRLIEKFAEGEA